MNLLMCPKCRNVHVDYYRVVDLAECRDCFHRFHLRRSSPPPSREAMLADLTTVRAGGD